MKLPPISNAKILPSQENNLNNSQYDQDKSLVADVPLDRNEDGNNSLILIGKVEKQDEEIQKIDQERNEEQDNEMQNCQMKIDGQTEDDKQDQPPQKKVSAWTLFSKANRKINNVKLFVKKMKKFSSYIRFTQSSRELFQMINDQAFDYNYFYFRDVFETEVLSFGRDDRLQIYSFLL